MSDSTEGGSEKNVCREKNKKLLKIKTGYILNYTNENGKEKNKGN